MTQVGQTYLYVALGAILGACARFFFTHLSSELSHHHGFPYGTLFVNVVGSLIVGFFLTWTQAQAADRSRLLVVVGFCGAFTTFSTFAWETMDYFRAGDFKMLSLNFVLNNVLCLLAIVAGVATARAFQR
jgi:CrcB protein